MPDASTASPWLTYLLGPQGLVVGLLALAFAFWREWIVPGSTHRRVLAERDRALARAERALHVTGRAIEVAAPATRK